MQPEIEILQNVQFVVKQSSLNLQEAFCNLPDVLVHDHLGKACSLIARAEEEIKLALRLQSPIS